MSHPVLPLTEVRAKLSPLLEKVASKKGALAISVHGKVRGYLVSAQRLDELEEAEQSAASRSRGRRSRLKGSLTLAGDLEEARRQVKRELMESFSRSAVDP